MFIWSRNAQVNFLGNLLLNRSDKPYKGNVVNQALPASWRCSWFPGNVRFFRKKYFGYFIKYELFQVTEACALVDDFKSLSRGDMTNVGEKGSKLSGGQKARISLGKNKPALPWKLNFSFKVFDKRFNWFSEEKLRF